MNIKENVSLAVHSTMRLGGTARYLAEADSEANLEELAEWAKSKNLPIITIGRGSNIVWRDEGFPGLVVVNKIMGREILAEDADSVTVKLSAGENWDQAVEWTVKQGWSGLEFMSLIPGTVGGAPVQNVGAYGGELAKSLIEVDAYDTEQGCFMGIMNRSCDFAYRTSRFKTKDHGRFLISAIVLKLKKANPTPPFYESLQKYLIQHQELGAPQSDYRLLRPGSGAGQASLKKEYTPQEIREAVTAIRQSKLPDPEKVANNGSFFTNPVVDDAKFAELKAKYSDIVGWDTKGGREKIAAGWLVEKAGFKGIHDAETGMATWPAQALVLVNEHARSTADLLRFKQKICDKVAEMFGIALQQEPELLP